MFFTHSFPSQQDKSSSSSQASLKLLSISNSNKNHKTKIDLYRRSADWKHEYLFIQLVPLRVITSVKLKSKLSFTASIHVSLGLSLLAPPTTIYHCLGAHLMDFDAHIQTISAGSLLFFSSIEIVSDFLQMHSLPFAYHSFQHSPKLH